MRGTVHNETQQRTRTAPQRQKSCRSIYIRLHYAPVCMRANVYSMVYDLRIWSVLRHPNSGSLGGYLLPQVLLPFRD